MIASAVGAVTGALASTHTTNDIDNESDNSSSSNGSSNDKSIHREEKNVGILAIEAYTPSTFVKQEALEEHSGVSKGRYTVGLGQDGLAVCGDAEDVNSLCLTVVHSLLEK